MKYLFLLFALIMTAPYPALANSVNAAAAQRLIDRITADPAVSGAVLYVHSPDTVSIFTSGYADRDQKIPISADHRFYIASITKTFTAVVLYKLAEQGIIDLDERISDHLDETFQGNLANYNHATIRQILSHTDGIPDYLPHGYYDRAAANHGFDASDPIAAVSMASGHPAPFNAGEGYAYSSTGYVLLCPLIEELTKSRASDVFAQEIFKPVGLSQTSFGSHPNLPDNLARGYADMNHDCRTPMDKPACIEDVTDTDWGDKLCDGGMVSTAKDLDTFLHALLIDKTLLSAKSLDDMLDITIEAPPNSGSGSGHGVTIVKTSFGHWIGHLGQYPGYRSAMLYIPEFNTTVIFWANGLFDMEKQFQNHLQELFQDKHISDNN